MLPNHQKIMTRILVFDTETTGLPKSRFSHPENTSEWPYIVQLSYIIYNTVLCKVEKVIDHIIRVPDEVTINEKCVSLHRISKERSLSEGIPIESCLSDFLNDFQTVDLVVAHNMEFDLNMIQVEMWRRKDFYEHMITIVCKSQKLFCTMQEGTDLCRIKSLFPRSKDPYKFPNLAELHQYLFSTLPINLHNSLNDVLICLRCYYKMKYHKDICNESSTISELMTIVL